jgi:hypothetical protein
MVAFWPIFLLIRWGTRPEGDDASPVDARGGNEAWAALTATKRGGAAEAEGSVTTFGEHYSRRTPSAPRLCSTAGPRLGSRS